MSNIAVSVSKPSPPELPPLADDLFAVLKAHKTHCQLSNVPFCTPYVFLALLENPSGITFKSLEHLRRGLGVELLEALRTYARGVLKQSERAYLDFSWESRKEIRQAQQFALQDAQTQVTDKYLFLGILHTQSKTQRSLKQFLGEEDFKRLVEIVILTPG